MQITSTLFCFVLLPTHEQRILETGLVASSASHPQRRGRDPIAWSMIVGSQLGWADRQLLPLSHTENARQASGFPQTYGKTQSTTISSTSGALYQVAGLAYSRTKVGPSNRATDDRPLPRPPSGNVQTILSGWLSLSWSCFGYP